MTYYSLFDFKLVYAEQNE